MHHNTSSGVILSSLWFSGSRSAGEESTVLFWVVLVISAFEISKQRLVYVFVSSIIFLSLFIYRPRALLPTISLRSWTTHDVQFLRRNPFENNVTASWSVDIVRVKYQESMSLTTAIAQYVMTMEVIEDAMEEEQIWYIYMP